IGTAVDFLNKKGENISPIPHQQLTETQENLLLKEFSSDKTLKEKSDKLIQKRQERENLVTVEVESIEKTSVTQNKTTVEEVDKIEKQKVEKKKTVAKSEDEDNLTRKDKNVIKHAHTDENINTEQRKKSKKKTEKDELPADEDNIGSKDKDNIEIKESVKEPVVKGTHESEQQLQTEKYSDVLVQQTDSSMIDKSLSDREISVVDADIDYQPQGEEHETQIFKYSEQKLEAPKVLGTINLDKIGKDSRPQPKTREERKKEYKEMVLRKREEEKRIKAERQKAAEKSTVKAEPQKNEQMRVTERRKEDFIKTNVPILQGPKIVDKVNIEPEKPIGKSYTDRDKTRGENKGDKKSKEHRKRDRIKIERIDITEDRGSSKSVKSFKKDRRNNRNPIDIEDVNQNIRETLAIAREGRKFNKKAVDYRKEKRENIRQEIERQVKLEMAQSKILTLTEFVTVNELASMMQVPVNDVIKVYMNLGMFVGINQRVDAESIKIVADEFGFETNFVSAEAAKNI
ncbi:MAG: translation initiation factor IF-2 N-terminal domain-containing protein, partial [Bacteroidetes bacterium]|nr:translation initiation factor IF-2 N-terminal domain-containing protein [Bacteroidota bacterium]